MKFTCLHKNQDWRRLLVMLATRHQLWIDLEDDHLVFIHIWRIAMNSISILNFNELLKIIKLYMYFSLKKFYQISSPQLHHLLSVLSTQKQNKVLKGELIESSLLLFIIIFTIRIRKEEYIYNNNGKQNLWNRHHQ